MATVFLAAQGVVVRDDLAGPSRYEDIPET